ncbi:MAG TPA: hypothetical protein VGM94_11670 [Galbitalea sp.]|jgi:hypothetical protein
MTSLFQTVPDPCDVSSLSILATAEKSQNDTPAWKMPKRQCRLGVTIPSNSPAAAAAAASGRRFPAP